MNNQGTELIANFVCYGAGSWLKFSHILSFSYVHKLFRKIQCTELVHESDGSSEAHYNWDSTDFPIILRYNSRHSSALNINLK